MSRFVIKDGSPLIAEVDLKRRVSELAQEMAPVATLDKTVLLGLMNGALVFLADLLRQLPPYCVVECQRLASYAGTQSTGRLHGLEMVGHDLAGRRVIIVDDILDTGLTLSSVRDRLHGAGATKVEVCVLLRKACRRQREVDARWVGFDIADEFVVGYGLDYNGMYRGLPDIRIGQLQD